MKPGISAISVMADILSCMSVPDIQEATRKELHLQKQ